MSTSKTDRRPYDPGADSKPTAVAIQQPGPGARVHRMRVDQIGPDLSQPRKRFANIESLGRTIQRIGLKKPITVRSSGLPAPLYLIKDGERRWRAHQYIGAEFIDVIIEEEDETAASERVAHQFIVNQQHEHHTLLEIVATVLHTHARYGSNKAVAECLELSAPAVSKLIKLGRHLSAIEGLAEAIDNGTVPDLEAAYTIAAIHEHDARAAAELIERIQTNTNPAFNVRIFAREKLRALEAARSGVAPEVKHRAVRPRLKTPKTPLVCTEFSYQPDSTTITVDTEHGPIVFDLHSYLKIADDVLRKLRP